MSTLVVGLVLVVVLGALGFGAYKLLHKKTTNPVIGSVVSAVDTVKKDANTVISDVGSEIKKVESL
jgi:hypothetical protein